MHQIIEVTIKKCSEAFLTVEMCFGSKSSPHFLQRQCFVTRQLKHFQGSMKLSGFNHEYKR